MATLLGNEKRGSKEIAGEAWRGDDDPLSACIGLAVGVSIGVGIYAWGLVLWLVI